MSEPRRKAGRPHKAPGEHFVEIPFWGPASLHDQLTKLARKREVSRSELMRRMLRKAIQPELQALSE